MARKKHIPFWKQLLRAILGLVLSIGFGLFWLALIVGIQHMKLAFAIGIIILCLGFLHLFFAIKKQVRYHH